jgi:hypothetical protein
MNTSYDLRFVTYLVDHPESPIKVRMYQVIAEGEKRGVIATGEGRTLAVAMETLELRLKL